MSAQRKALARGDAHHGDDPHIAIQKRDADGNVVSWMEHVSDEQYQR